MSEIQEQENLFRYLDAKFEGVNTRIDGLQALWDVEAKECHTERKDLVIRMRKIESWRSYLTGGFSVVALLASGVLGWLFRLVGTALVPK